MTAPNQRNGYYDNALKIDKLALAEYDNLKQAAEQLGYIRPRDFERRVAPAAMPEPSFTLPGGGG